MTLSEKNKLALDSLSLTQKEKDWLASYCLMFNLHFDFLLVGLVRDMLKDSSFQFGQEDD